MLRRLCEQERFHAHQVAICPDSAARQQQAVTEKIREHAQPAISGGAGIGEDILLRDDASRIVQRRPGREIRDVAVREQPHWMPVAQEGGDRQPFEIAQRSTDPEHLNFRKVHCSPVIHFR